MELGGLTPDRGFDRLVVNGEAVLGGALNVTLVNGFAPGFGDTFPVLGYNSRNGSFATVNLPLLPDALALTAQYSPTRLTLLSANAGWSNETNMLAIVRSPEGDLELRFSGEPGRIYRVQASTNLVHWLDLHTNTPANGLFRFIDVDAMDINHRFYRAVTP